MLSSCVRCMELRVVEGQGQGQGRPGLQPAGSHGKRSKCKTDGAALFFPLSALSIVVSCNFHHHGSGDWLAVSFRLDSITRGKNGRLLHVDILMENPMEECILDVNLTNGPITRDLLERAKD